MGFLRTDLPDDEDSAMRRVAAWLQDLPDPEHATRCVNGWEPSYYGLAYLHARAADRCSRGGRVGKATRPGIVKAKVGKARMDARGERTQAQGPAGGEGRLPLGTGLKSTRLTGLLRSCGRQRYN